MKRKHRRKTIRQILYAGFAIILTCCALVGKFGDASTPFYKFMHSGQRSVSSTAVSSTSTDFSFPEYSGQAYAVINKNMPNFPNLSQTSYEHYSQLDNLGRCGVAEACLSKETMPKQKRGDISAVKPTGWKQAYYENVNGKMLYNRCHLIAHELAGENANEKNLITGTRYMNVDGMLPFENQIADYIKETGNHVMYRVTPRFQGNELVARGVEMEAESVEDKGEGILFHVYCFNVQPGITIDYTNGASHAN